ncbi:pre-B-cell leukemia transcription factor-interacting protein 1-like isoform X2 [Mustelus asterias]
MASFSNVAPKSGETLGTAEESVVDTRQDRMDQHSIMTECPGSTETTRTPCEQGEGEPVEIGTMDKKDTVQEEQDAPLADGTGSDGLPSADVNFTLPGQTDGTDDTQTAGLSAEEIEDAGDISQGLPVTGTEPAGSCSIQVEKVLEVKRGESWGERLRAIMVGGFSAPVLRDIEEIGSLQDGGSGLRKRQLPDGPRGTPALRGPPAVADEDDNGGVTLNKCLLVALLLVGVGFGIFDPEGEVSEADSLGKRAVDGSLPSELEFPAPSQPWIAETSGGGADTVISLSGLLDKLASDNQQIRIMHVELQGQKEELEGLLKQDGGRLPAESLDSLTRLTRHLSEHLSHEERTLASLQEELRELRLKMEAAEGASAGRGSAPAPGEGRLGALLAQKETLAAEALMLRRELDKQRGIIVAMRQALESLIERVVTLGANLEAPTVLQGLEEMEHRLAFELERSEIWAKVYGTPKEERKKAKEAKRAQQASVGLGEQPGVVGPTDNLGNQPDVLDLTDKLGDLPDVGGPIGSLGDQPDVVGPTDNQGNQPDVLDPIGSLGNQPDKLGPIGSLGEQPDPKLGPTGSLGEPAPDIMANQPADIRGETAVGNLDAPQANATQGTAGRTKRAPAESTSARDAPRGGRGDPATGSRAQEWRGTPDEVEGGGKPWKKRREEGGQGGEGERRGGRVGKEHGRKAEGPRRFGKGGKGPKEAGKGGEGGGKPRHHEHNKFWKKNPAPSHLKHRYRAPTGCSDVVTCARQEGMELFKVPLEPVRAERFSALLDDYVRASRLGGDWGRELQELAAPFFPDGVFVHHQTRFRDFLDDLEDFVEGIAERVFGDDDAVEDFEDYIFRGLLGQAATKHKSSKKDSWRSGEKTHKHREGYRPANHAGKHHHKDWEKDRELWRDYKRKAGDTDR